MWSRRLAGLLIAVFGASLLVFLWFQVTHASHQSLMIYRMGIPGVLLASALGATAVLFGGHLLLAPETAIRRWTFRPPGGG